MKQAEGDALVERAKAGDREAFRQLFLRHRGDVSRLAFRMLGRASDLDDVVQEVFLQVHRSLADFRGQSKFSTWLHRVTVNVVLMSRRAAKSRPVFAGEAGTETTPFSGPSPLESISKERRLQAFRRVLERLPEKKRTVFVLHELEGMPPAEIATIVDAPVLTVRTRLFYARRELCELMKDEPSLANLAELMARGDGSKGDGGKGDGSKGDGGQGDGGQGGGQGDGGQGDGGQGDGGSS